MGDIGGAGCKDATILLAVLAWDRLRRRLADYRRAAGLEEAELAKLMGVNRSTVYRIEKVTELPDHKPTLLNVDAWLTATNGPPLSEFFAEIENLQNVALQVRTGTTKNPPTHSHEGDEADHGDSVSTDALADVERAIGRSIVRAVRLAQAGKQTPSTRSDRATRRHRSRKNR